MSLCGNLIHEYPHAPSLQTWRHIPGFALAPCIVNLMRFVAMFTDTQRAS
jgi:hypothetical protein